MWEKLQILEIKLFMCGFDFMEVFGVCDLNK